MTGQDKIIGDDPRRTRFRVDGMDCASCARKVETAAKRFDGVSDVSVSVMSGAMTVTHRAGLDLDGLAAAVSRLGYAASPVQAASGTAEARSDRTDDHDSDRHHDHHHDHDHHGHSLDHADHDHADHDHACDDHAAHPHAGGHGKAAGEGEISRGAGSGHVHDSGDGDWWRGTKARLTLACGGALVAAAILSFAVPAIGAYGYVAAMAVGLIPIARRAVAAALQGSPFSIEMLMTVAAAGAVVIGAAEEAAVVVFLFLVGELLEGVAASRARSSIRGLVDLVPRIARREADGRVEEVPAADLAVGDRIVVRPGDRLPADGTVTGGESAVDEAPVTGESAPKAKAPGDPVFAGTVNGEGMLVVEVTAASEDNTIARIVRLVEEAQEARSPTERFVDRFASRYTPAVIAVALLVAVGPPLFAGAEWATWVYRGLAVLLIGCPCALVISTPAAIAAGLSAGARRGLLMKGGAVLEKVGTLTAVALDKTGTLTRGSPAVTDVAGLRGTAPADVLALAAALETGSSHPLARAILAKAGEEGIRPSPAAGMRAVPGRGIEGAVDGRALFLGSVAAAAARAEVDPADLDLAARFADEGKSVSMLLVDDRPAGLLALRDEPRPDARRGLDALRAAGLQTVMLTGDNRRTAEAVGALLGVEPRAELLPEDKQRIVRELQSAGHRVGKVGDGINDAPALAAADVGIAMGGGTDVALETADAAVLHGRVSDIADMVELSRRVMANIRQNIAIALGLKGLFLVTTVAGITGLWPAILADTGATVLVTANAMRLLAWKGGDGKT